MIFIIIVDIAQLHLCLPDICHCACKSLTLRLGRLVDIAQPYLCLPDVCHCACKIYRIQQTEGISKTGLPLLLEQHDRSVIVAAATCECYKTLMIQQTGGIDTALLLFVLNQPDVSFTVADAA